MEKVSESEEKYEKLMGSLYLDKRINYSPETDCIVVKGMHSFGGYYDGTLKKGIIKDVDDTITLGDILPIKWIYTLSEINTAIRIIRDEIIEYYRTIPFLDIATKEQTIKKLGKRLKESRLQYEEYKESALYAAKQLTLVPFTEEFICELDEMGYTVSLNSGSPQLCVEALGKRLNVSKRIVGMDRVYPTIFGTELKFDNGYFTGEMSIGLGNNKEKGMSTFLRGLKCSDNLSIFVSDDPPSDRIPASKAGCSLWVDLGKNEFLPKPVERWFKEIGLTYGIYKLPGKFSIYCPEARENMNYLLVPIKRYNLLITVLYLRSPQAELELCKLSRRFNELNKNLSKAREKSYEYERDKADFLVLTREIQGLVKPIITERSLNVSDSLRQLQSSENMETDKNLMSDIFNMLKFRIIEIQVPEKFGKGLISIVDEKQLFNSDSELYDRY
jgi:phosphoserine phosphatase